MKHSRAVKKFEEAWPALPDVTSNNQVVVRLPLENDVSEALAPIPQPALPKHQNDGSVVQAPAFPAQDRAKATTMSFLNLNQHGDLLVSFLKARKRTFIDRLNWDLPETEGMEFDQYDTPKARWIVIYEAGEVLAGIRLIPTTAKCGIYTYMLKDAQQGLLENIPTDVLFFDAPVDPNIWEASRLFISEDIPAQRRVHIQNMLMEKMAESARELGAHHVIGIVPAVWSRWLRRLELNAVPVGPRFSIDGTAIQAALFNVNQMSC